MKFKRIVKTKALLLAPVLLLTFSLNAQTKKWIAPVAANSIKNPVAADAQSISQGKTLYTTYCSPCHGLKGKGDGPAAANLQVKPADHTSATVQAESDGAIFWKIGEGFDPMPSYKTALTETQRWAIVNYIRTLAKTSKK